MPKNVDITIQKVYNKSKIKENYIKYKIGKIMKLSEVKNVKINISNGQRKIANYTNSFLGEYLNNDNSTISRYRNGRAIDNNLSILKLYLLQELDKEKNQEFPEDNIEEFNYDEVIYFKNNWEKMKNKLKRHGDLMEDFLDKITNSEIAFGNKIYERIKNDENYLKFSEYKGLVRLNKFMKFVSKLNSDKIENNLKYLIENSGKTQMKLAEEQNKPINYLPTILLKHRTNKSYIQYLTSKQFEVLAKMFTNGNVLELKKFLLS